jgi:hypothetical protein
MQELITYAGHLECYAKSGEILKKFTRVKVGPSQVYRVTDRVGESLEEEEKQTERILPPAVERGCSLCRDRRLHAFVRGKKKKSPGRKSGRAGSSRGATA